METLARSLILIGVILILIGGLIYLVSKVGLPIGRLPGDIRIERENFRFYFPLASSLLLSLLLTLLLNLLIRWRR